MSKQQLIILHLIQHKTSVIHDNHIISHVALSLSQSYIRSTIHEYIDTNVMINDELKDIYNLYIYNSYIYFYIRVYVFYQMVQTGSKIVSAHVHQDFFEVCMLFVIKRVKDV